MNIQNIRIVINGEINQDCKWNNKWYQDNNYDSPVLVPS
jgi:hypothetical protein